ncbi:DUF4279 domain-containing protein [Microlunatus sp. GCM10028923]|uniref:DUF4279 domain-containing protein n=1 Tax=Microlunatus sp. GCM10028923 TaxID=3273400 RepID=UPI0036204353
MRIRQYVYLALTSSKLSASQIGQRIGLEPDEVGVLGSRRADPPRPPRHTWKLVCREPGLRVDEQIGQLLVRLRPHRDAIAEFARELRRDDPNHGGGRFFVVRNFDHEDGEEELLSPPDAEFQKLPGQHQLLGFDLDAELMAFLVEAQADLDVDEYG